MTTARQAPQTPNVRARVRPALADAVSAPVESTNNETLLKGQLDKLVADTAIANDLKNRGTREEKAAKGNLEKLLNANELTHHETMVKFPDGSVIPYVADIAPGFAEAIDMRELANRCGIKVSGPKEAQEMFFSMISTSFKAVEEKLGSNICAQLKRSKATLPSLSVSKKK